jgi:hypothetical protein
MLASQHRPIDGMENNFTIADIGDVAKFEGGSARSHQKWSDGVGVVE